MTSQSHQWKNAYVCIVITISAASRVTSSKAESRPGTKPGTAQTKPGTAKTHRSKMSSTSRQDTRERLETGNDNESQLGSRAEPAPDAISDVTAPKTPPGEDGAPSVTPSIPSRKSFLTKEFFP